MTNENIYEVNENVEANEEFAGLQLVEDHSDPETTGGGVNKIVVGLGVAAVAAGAVAWHKTKNKREEFKAARQQKKEEKLIKKLEACNYTVCKNEEVELVEAEVVEETDKK